MRDPLPRLRLRIRFGGDDFIGPGKVELLERIAVTGSIAAAARDMGMSYKRAWSIIETLNAMFDMALVESTRGGPGKGGAALTGRGREVLAEYLAILAAADEHGRDSIARLQSWVRVKAPEDGKGG
ncbi:MAG: winged helix-turn-helix domain-containing protein [Tabrizicola sp.]|nr:winged helix-turn-helix domain-containing protein [Tabrizicola sp.]HMS95921.1 winged helix-turn-helix domain-containing protein [Tabrizicola sp.]